jgi:hypothetical protein
MFEVDSSTVTVIEHHFRKRRDFEWSEQFFLGEIAARGNPYGVLWSVVALRRCGSSRALGPLKELITYPKADVQSCALLTIAAIGGAAETEFFAESLVGPRCRDKAYAMLAIESVADERALPSVTKFLRSRMSQIRKSIANPSSHYKSTVVSAAKYLMRYSEANRDAQNMLLILKDLYLDLPYPVTSTPEHMASRN